MSEPSAAVLDDVVTDKELAEFLGVTTVQLALRRDLKRILIGKRRLYFKQTVVDWLRAKEGR